MRTMANASYNAITATIDSTGSFNYYNMASNNRTPDQFTTFNYNSSSFAWHIWGYASI
jgi:hypothetical protein